MPRLIDSIRVAEVSTVEQLIDHQAILRHFEVLLYPDTPDALMVHAEWTTADGLGSKTEAFRFDRDRGFSLPQEMRLRTLIGDGLPQLIERLRALLESD